ncbi:transcription factor JunB [Falco cherrug]|uniref:transcription factor JunB n=1 Tax=Falco cherrug TaxID=345164 RepID=UPI00247860FD|nr:transcription factor JunB [Falco cherrug]
MHTPVPHAHRSVPPPPPPRVPLVVPPSPLHPHAGPAPSRAGAWPGEGAWPGGRRHQWGRASAPGGYKAGGRRGGEDVGSSPAAAIRPGSLCGRMCARMEPSFYRPAPFPGGFCRPEPDYGALPGALPPGTPPEPFRGLKPPPCPDGSFFGGGTGTGSFFYPVPGERDGFTGSFTQALDELHQPGPPNVALPEPAGLAAGGGTPFPGIPGVAPEAEATEPAPESPERLQAERRRLRNRLAASRCRRRKLERIARLEQRVRGLRAQNAALAATAAGLRAQVRRLRGSVRDHAGSGCPLPPGAALGF